MHNVSKSNKKKLLRNSSIGVLCFGILFFGYPYTVFADNPPDRDDDGIADVDDNCPDVGNPHQYDIDGDGIGIVCDPAEPDQDNDGIGDADDNCPAVANPKQFDLDHDGIGIVCDNPDPDQDNDGIGDTDDNCPAVANPKQFDLDHDGIGVACDDDTIDDQAAVNRALFFEAQARAARTRAIIFEGKEMRARERYIAFEANAMAAREREQAAARRQREREMRERNAPGPMVGCEGCHSNILSEVRRIVGANGDFSMNSHHVRGTVVSIDCLACHYTGDHRSGIVKLVDPDQGTAIIYEYDPDAPEEIEPFCLNCHDSDGSNAGLWTKPFSDQVKVPNVKGVAGSLWTNSAHKTIDYDLNGARPITCLGDGMVNGCHANGHGSANSKILAADAGTSLDRFCYNCHTEGKVMNNALSGSMDDIEQAFSASAKHNVGTPFTVNGKDFTLQCTSCHNPHVVTGKHWNAQDQVSPVTRPDFTADPTTNPHAMGSTLWGAVAGEKMDDYAALGTGSGGWYFSVARGRTVQMDQPAVYQPPKTGSYPNFEFDGDILPDYTSLCLDCHSYRMGNHPPVNWGQGVDCTDNSVDPPDQRVECGAQHGFGVAGRPYAMDTGSTVYGSNGNPDPIFQQWNVQRGRGAGQFMRWPYDSAERNAGINFVMACTDCHEAHGSGVPSMLRETVNNGPGTRTWNTMCNNCHYYYGYQHAGMSCATASCHEATSIHRITHTTNSGGTYLWTEPSKPTTTPEILSAQSILGSTELFVTFTEGVFTNSDQTGALEGKDFVLVDQNSDNAKTITGVVHTPGEATATVEFSEPLIFEDFGADTLATAGMSIWNVAGTPAGPWPVTVTELPPFNVQSVLYGSTELKLNGIVNDSKLFYVTFTEGAYSNTGGDLQIGDFLLDCDDRIITSVTHTAGDNFAILTLDTIVNQAEVGGCTVAAAFGSIFDSYGNIAGTDPVTLALPPEASVNDMVLRWDFNEGTGTVTNSNGALGTEEDMHGVLTRNVDWVASTKPGATAGDNAVSMDRVSDRGAVQLNYTVNPDDNFPPATYSSGGAHIIVQEMEQTSEFSFSAWIKPTALGCDEGKTLGLNNKLRRDVLTTQFWIKNWALGIMRFSDDGDPISGNCTDEDSTHDVLRFWVAVGDPTDMRCDAWGGSWPEYVHPVNPAGYIQGNTLMPTDQAVCDTSSTPTLPTNTQAYSFAQTETSASGAPSYSGVALQPGVWQHVVGTWDGRYIRIYIDGQLAAETDMGGTGNFVMVADPNLWGGDLVGDGSLYRHVSSFFSAGARPIFSTSGSPAGGAVYWNTNGFYDLNNYTYVGELDDVKYWKIALPSATIQD